MARTIHQLYCTHCTYGTAAQHRHTGSVRSQPFEYSTRAASVVPSRSHQTFQRIEKQVFRGIPMAGDASVEVRRSTANEAPWRRLVYFPSVDGLRVLANVCYRPKDTAGRLGSYFAHVLLEEHVDGHDPWNPADCLKLWGASFWQTIDTEISDLPAEAVESSFVLEPLDSVDRPGYGSRVNDEALLSFLQSPAEETSQSPEISRIECALSVFPTRWRKKPAKERSQLFTNLLRLVLELDLERQERLTIAIEPGVAALLFYGIARLLPPEGLVQQLSFSTFESHLDKSLTTLTAHDFADPMATDLLPETYRVRGFAINTYRPATKIAFRRPESQYAEMMVQTFLSEGTVATDRLLSHMAAVGKLNRESCESLVSVRLRVKNMLYVEGTSITDFSRWSSVEKQFAGHVCADLIATTTDDAVKSLARRQAYLSVLEMVSGIADDPVARQATLRLLKFLPTREDVRNAFFSLASVAPSLKVAWLRSYLKKNEQFPQNCPGLYETSSRTNAVLTELLQTATAEHASVWRECVPVEYSWCFAAALATAAQQDPQKRPLLLSVLESLDDNGLSKLLDKSSGRADLILANIKPDEVKFVQRLTRLHKRICTSSPDRIVAHVEALLAVSSRLPFLKPSLDRWATARDTIKRLGQYSAVPIGKPTGELESALSQVLRAVGDAMSDLDDQFTPLDTDINLIEAMLRGWLRADQNDLRQQAMVLLPKLQLAATDDTELCAFLASEKGAAWLKKYPRSEQSLSQRLQKVVEELPDNLSSLQTRLTGLTTARAFLGVQASRLDVWNRLCELLGWVKVLREQFKSATLMAGREVMRAADDLGPLVFSAFGSHLSFDPSRKPTSKLTSTHYLQSLSRATIGDNTLLDARWMLLGIEREYENQASRKGGIFSGKSAK